MKEYFEQQMNCSIYDILPNVKETTFIDVPLLKACIEAKTPLNDFNITSISVEDLLNKLKK